MKHFVKIIIIAICLCGLSFTVGYSLGEHKTDKCLEEYALVTDTAGLFSDIIRMHWDNDCPYIKEDIELILDADSLTATKILGNYAYCY